MASTETGNPVVDLLTTVLHKLDELEALLEDIEGRLAEYGVPAFGGSRDDPDDDYGD